MNVTFAPRGILQIDDARLIGYTNEQIYDLSQKLINGNRNEFFGTAYNLSYTDMYDFCTTKQSLKKWEIELGIV